MLYGGDAENKLIGDEYSKEEGPEKYIVMTGVAQGFTFETLLRSVMNDAVFDSCVPKQATVICFAADLAAVVATKS